MRFFISQETLDELVGGDRASFQDDVLEIPARGLRAPVEPAVYFLREVEGKADPNELVGKVKTVEAIAERGGDQFRASVILGDVAYDVVEGHLGRAEEGWTWPGTVEEAGPSPPAAMVEQPAAPSRTFSPRESPPPPADRPRKLPTGDSIDLRASVMPPPPADEPDEIVVDVFGGQESGAAPGSAGRSAGPDSVRRPVIDDATRARLRSRPGYHQATAPEPEPAVRPNGAGPSRPSRPPSGFSRLPAPTPGIGARASRPPPTPGAARRAFEAPEEEQPVRSPAKTADELEKILLETIRPKTRKRP